MREVDDSEDSSGLGRLGAGMLSGFANVVSGLVEELLPMENRTDPARQP